MLITNSGLVGSTKRLQYNRYVDRCQCYLKMQDCLPWERPEVEHESEKDTTKEAQSRVTV